jgi:sugar phosphate permease
MFRRCYHSAHILHPGLSCVHLVPVILHYYLTEKRTKPIHKPKIFYGWYIVGVGFLAQFMGIGVSAYATSVFFQAMFSDLGWTRGDLSLSMSVGAILAAILSPFVGTFVDKHGANWIMAASAFATGICLILSGYVHELWQAFIIFSLLAAFRVGFVSIPVMTMVSNWFSDKKGRALGLTTAGQGLGGFVLSPLSIYLISGLGWRMAWGAVGLLTWVVMIPASLLIAKQKPATMGLLVDNKEPEAIKKSSIAEEEKRDTLKSNNWTLSKILRMPNFWFVAILQTLYLFGHASIFQHGYSLFTDKGISAMTAGTMLGILGLFSLGGKIVLGYLSDRISVRYVMMIALAFAALSIFPLFWAEPTQGAWLFIVFWGFWECGVIALQPILVATLFDRAITGKMLGLFAMFSVISQLMGPTFMGYIYDITGNYNLALSAFVVFYVISLVLVLFTRPPKRTLNHGFLQ